jgi:hypothetical protein
MKGEEMHLEAFDFDRVVSLNSVFSNEASRTGLCCKIHMRVVEIRIGYGSLSARIELNSPETAFIIDTQHDSIQKFDPE